MRNEKFKIIDFIRQLIVSVDTELENFPNKELELKRRISNNSYDILEIAYKANSIQDIKEKVSLLNAKANSIQDIKEKVSLLNAILAKIKVIDFLLNLANDKQLITKKKYVKLAERIDDITKYTCGWMNSLTKNEMKQNIINS